MSPATAAVPADRLADARDRLTAAMATAARGPRRNGLFALWLLVRAADGLLPPQPLTARAHRARLDSLGRRLSSLSLPAGLRRACNDLVRDLQEADAAALPAALQRAVAPTREAIGAEASEALALSVRLARGALR